MAAVEIALPAVEVWLQRRQEGDSPRTLTERQCLCARKSVVEAHAQTSPLPTPTPSPVPLPSSLPAPSPSPRPPQTHKHCQTALAQGHHVGVQAGEAPSAKHAFVQTIKRRDSKDAEKPAKRPVCKSAAAQTVAKKTKESPAQVAVNSAEASSQTEPQEDAVQDDVVARVLLEHAGVVYRTRDPRRAVNYLDLSKLGEEGETPASEEIWLAVDDDGADEDDDDENKGFLSSSEDDHSLSVETDKLSMMATLAGHTADDNLVSSLTSSSPQSVLVSAGVPTEGRKEVVSAASETLVSASATQLLHGVLIEELVPIADTLQMTEKNVIDLTLKFQQVETLLQSLCSAVDHLRSTSTSQTVDSLLARLESLAADMGALDASGQLREDNNQLRKDLSLHRQREEFLVGRMQQMETALAGLDRMQPVTGTATATAAKSDGSSQHNGGHNAKVEGSAAPPASTAPAAAATAVPPAALPVSMPTAAEESVTNASSAPPPDSAPDKPASEEPREAALPQPPARANSQDKEEAKKEIKKALLKKAKEIDKKEPLKNGKAPKVSKPKPVATKSKDDEPKPKPSLEKTKAEEPKKDLSPENPSVVVALPDQASAIEKELVVVESKENCSEDWKVTITSSRDLELVAESPQTVIVSPKPQEPTQIAPKVAETKIPVVSKAPKLKPPIKPKTTAKEPASKAKETPPKAVKARPVVADARSDPIPKPAMLPVARPPRDYRPALAALAVPQSDRDSTSRCSDDGDVIHMVIREDRDAASVGDHCANPSLFQVRSSPDGETNSVLNGCSGRASINLPEEEPNDQKDILMDFVLSEEANNELVLNRKVPPLRTSHSRAPLLVRRRLKRQRSRSLCSQDAEAASPEAERINRISLQKGTNKPAYRSSDRLPTLTAFDEERIVWMKAMEDDSARDVVHLADLSSSASSSGSCSAKTTAPVAVAAARNVGAARHRRKWDTSAAMRPDSLEVGGSTGERRRTRTPGAPLAAECFVVSRGWQMDSSKLARALETVVKGAAFARIQVTATLNQVVEYVRAHMDVVVVHIGANELLDASYAADANASDVTSAASSIATVMSRQIIKLAGHNKTTMFLVSLPLPRRDEQASTASVSSSATAQRNAFAELRHTFNASLQANCSACSNVVMCDNENVRAADHFSSSGEPSSSGLRRLARNWDLRLSRVWRTHNGHLAVRRMSDTSTESSDANEDATARKH